VFRGTAFRSLRAVLALCVVAGPVVALASPAAEAAVENRRASHEDVACIVVGFVGGFVRHDDLNHGPVQFAARSRSNLPKNTYLQVFENRHRKQAYRTILKLLDADGDGVLSAAEKARARIILYGQSWGGSAVVMLARDLNRVGIPVMLTVQMDSVAKPWQKDGIIPQNVAAAANFYQPNGIIHGRSEITAADPAKTQILGNYRSDYRKTPAKCGTNSWADRTFTPGHMQSECDPKVWAQIETLMRERIPTSPNVADANSQAGGSQF
jgi:hypothetical protein